MHVEPVGPDPNSLRPGESRSHSAEGYLAVGRNVHDVELSAHDLDPYSPEIIGHSPEGTYFTPSSSSH